MSLLALIFLIWYVKISRNFLKIFFSIDYEYIPAKPDSVEFFSTYERSYLLL